MTIRQNHILSPNPLVMTITVNEFNGNINVQNNRIIPHLQAIVTLAQVTLGQCADSLAQAKNGVINPHVQEITAISVLAQCIIEKAQLAVMGPRNQQENPGNNPGDFPGDTPPGKAS